MEEDEEIAREEFDAGDLEDVEAGSLQLWIWWVWVFHTSQLTSASLSEQTLMLLLHTRTAPVSPVHWLHTINSPHSSN